MAKRTPPDLTLGGHQEVAGRQAGTQREPQVHGQLRVEGQDRPWRRARRPVTIDLQSGESPVFLGEGASDNGVEL